MELTIRDVHTHQTLVNKGLVEPIRLRGVATDSVIVPSLDNEDRVYFSDLTDGTKVYPGQETIQKILKDIVDNS